MAEHLTKQDFLDKVFDFENEKEWTYKGDLPCIIDFYADWCGPCKIVAPILDELSEEFQGKMDVYKIDTDAEAELSAAFRIQSIPTILFVPKEGKPHIFQGALPKDSFLSNMKTLLKVE